MHVNCFAELEYRTAIQWGYSGEPLATTAPRQPDPTSPEQEYSFYTQSPVTQTLQVGQVIKVVNHLKIKLTLGSSDHRNHFLGSVQGSELNQSVRFEFVDPIAEPRETRKRHY